MALTLVSDLEGSLVPFPLYSTPVSSLRSVNCLSSETSTMGGERGREPSRLNNNHRVFSQVPIVPVPGVCPK